MLFDPESLSGSRYRQRNFTAVVGIIFALVLLRLFTMQVLQGGKYRELSEENRIRVEVIAAPRGDIRDRNGLLLADNVPSFTVTLDPFDKTYVDNPGLLDSTVARLGVILGVDATLLREKVQHDGRQSFLPVRLRRNVDRTTVAYVAEHESVLPGVDVEFEPLRRYPLGLMASHLLGYVGEVSDKELEDPDRAEYLRGDLIGKMGIERQYESYLRGEAGKRSSWARNTRSSPSRARPSRSPSTRTSSARPSRPSPPERAARRSRWTRAPARCWRWPPSPITTPTNSRPASPRSGGARSVRAATFRSSTAPSRPRIRPAPPSSPSSRWRD